MGNKKEQTREMILEASYPLFAKDGFNKITMKDICEATGLSRGGLYSHFSGTGEIFEAILSKLNEKDEMDFHIMAQSARIGYFVLMVLASLILFISEGTGNFNQITNYPLLILVGLTFVILPITEFIYAKKFK